MKKILVPCDFSEPSLEALKFAFDIATVVNAEVDVLRVIEIPFLYESAYGIQPYLFDPTLLETMDENARTGFEKVKKDLAADESRVSFHVVHGLVTPSIRNFIDANNIDLVIMGTHGASGLKEFFVGSNTEKIVRFSPVPVFAVKKAPKTSTIKNIVFPSTLGLDQEKLITKIKEIQRIFGATLHILLINTPTQFKNDREAKEALDRFEKHYAFSNHTLNLRNDTFEPDAIIEFASEVKADLIAMATHGRRGLMHLLTGSIAEDVVNHAENLIWTYSVRD